MMTPQISIIVPVFNVEKYLSDCIESILAQTFTNFELLLIDDGSSDKSKEICNEYANRDSRIKVHHKPNGGVSSARNKGLEIASGKYIMFVDADDTITSNCLATCIEVMDKNDLDFYQFQHSQIIARFEDKQIYGKILNFDNYLSINHPICVGGGVYRTSIIRSANMSFKNGLKLGEDQLFVFEYISLCSKLMYENKMMYNYRINYESATHRRSIVDINESITRFLNFRSQHPVFTQKINLSLLVLFFSKEMIGSDSIFRLAHKFRQFQIKGKHTQICRSCKIFYSLTRISPLLGMLWAKTYFTVKQ